MIKPRSIPDAIAQLGIEGRETEDELSAMCPLHDERSASFSINTKTGLWICYSGCGGGNLGQLAQKLLGLTSAETKRWTRGLGVAGAPVLRAVPSPVLEVFDEDAWLDVTAEPPDEALAKRRISREVARELGIRWNPWNPDREGGKPGSDPCWMIPLRNPEGFGLCGWQSKGSVTGNAQTTGKKAATLFGIELFEQDSTAVLVESPLDVAVLLTAGIRGGLSSLGASVSKEQMRLLGELATRLVEAMDDDGAGFKSAAKLYRARELKHLLPVSFGYDSAWSDDKSGRKDVGDMTVHEIRRAAKASGLRCEPGAS